MRRKGPLPAIAVAAVAAMILAGCSSTGESTTTGGGSQSGTTPAGSSSSAGSETGSGASDDTAGKKGGTLSVLSNGDVDRLDPQLAAYVPTNGVMRALSRSILSYKASNDADERIELQADLAAEIPAASADGLTYAVTLRDGVMWDAPGGPRAITSQDVARGIKRICNPYVGAALGSYFINLIKGMDEFCTGFADVKPEAGPMKDYIEGHDIAGIATPDDSTVVFTLVEPASDFTSMLSLPTANPAPIEVLDYLPDSPEYRDNFISSGPYKIAEYQPDVKMSLERNPAWKADSDPLRAAYVDTIEMTMGVENDAGLQQVQAGSADMLFDLSPTPAMIQQMTATGDPNLSSMENGGVDQFMWINTLSSNNGGALKKLEVRQALQYAIDKPSVVQVVGGPDIATVTNGIFGPGINGYEPFAPYGNQDGTADPEKAKQMLADAGVTNLTLKLPYRNLGSQPDIAQTVAASLEKAGITVELSPVPPTDYYANFMTNPENATNGVWDIALVGWSPDWVGGAARSVFQPQFTFDGTHQSYNYIDFNSDKADALAAQALAASSPEEAGTLWHQVDEAVMADSPVVSIIARKKVNYHSSRVQNFEIYALAQNGDWTNVWLNG